MGHPTKRETTSKGAGANNFAMYASLEDSVKDFLLWWQYNRITFPDNPTEAVRLMKSKGYFTDTIENYTKAVNWFYNN